jgi:hypothetical protein
MQRAIALALRVRAAERRKNVATAEGRGDVWL